MDALTSFFINIITFLDVIVVQLIFTIAFLAFLWGIYRYFVAGAADEEKRKEGRNFILYSLIGFFLMFSIWGIVNLLIGATGFGGGTRPPIPGFDSSGGTFGGSGGPGSGNGGGIIGGPLDPDPDAVAAGAAVTSGDSCTNTSQCNEGEWCSGRIALIQAGTCVPLEGYHTGSVGQPCYGPSECVDGEVCAERVWPRAGVCALPR